MCQQSSTTMQLLWKLTARWWTLDSGILPDKKNTTDWDHLLTPTAMFFLSSFQWFNPHLSSTPAKKYHLCHLVVSWAHWERRKRPQNFCGKQNRLEGGIPGFEERSQGAAHSQRKCSQDNWGGVPVQVHGVQRFDPGRLKGRFWRSHAHRFAEKA